MQIPSFLLNKVYVRGSLRSIENGFEFVLKNIVDAGTLGKVNSLLVDGDETPLGKIIIQAPSGDYKADEISFRNSVPLRRNVEIPIQVLEKLLGSGEHHILLNVSILEAGALEFDITEEL